jgi:hypothetical protein
MAVAGYLEYDPVSGRFTLPPEHAAVLAEEGGPMFLGGLYHILPPLVAPLDQLIQAFREGGGVHQRGGQRLGAVSVPRRCPQAR